jgi:hypothetical protein
LPSHPKFYFKDLTGFALPTTFSRPKQKGILPNRFSLVKQHLHILENYFQGRNSRFLAIKLLSQEKRLHRPNVLVWLWMSKSPLSGKEAL